MDRKDSKGLPWIVQGFNDFLKHMEPKIRKYGLMLGFNDCQ
jgi:hypothetical protein